MKKNWRPGLWIGWTLIAALGTGAPARAQANPEGYLLNLYHFNIQYVVGSEPSMRRIVKQSFEPLVDFYLDHPGWGADFEMQGVMIEYLAEQYPEVLEKFKRLVNSGQAELVTFHFTDQLLLAFPAHDQEWSLRLNDRLLERHGIRRSGVIFTQEAQFGEGLARVGRAHAYQAAVMTVSQYRWFQDDPRFPYFTVQGLKVITNRDAEDPGTGLRVKWLFLGDGELVAAGGVNPYFPGLFRTNPARLALLARQMEQAEEQGWRPSTISDYLAGLDRAGVQPQPLLPILDSPWRPEDGSGVFQWMGKYSFPWERDYDLRTRNWQTRNLLVEAEAAGADPETLARAWSHQLNAEVSDPTGWFPLPVEVRFAYQQMEEAVAALADDPVIDLDAVISAAQARPACAPGPIEPPIKLRTFGAAADAELKWRRLEADSGYGLEVAWTGRGDAGMAFPLAGNTLEYCPALMEDSPQAVNFRDIKGKDLHLGLPNGLLGLGGRTWLVCDHAAGTVAAGVYPAAREIVFEVRKAREERIALNFYLLLDRPAEEAAQFANRLNRIRP